MTRATTSVGDISRTGRATSQGPADAASWLSGHTTIAIVPIRHPVIEALGHAPTSEYAEGFWLPVVGPSALWVHRRLTAGFATHHSGYQLNLATLGREVGLGAGTGRNAPVVRTIRRLVDFHLAEIVDEEQLAVYTRLPPLTRRQAARLPAHLAVRHRSLTHRSDVEPSGAIGGSMVEAGL
jgi:hypothetical protein